MQHMKAYKPNFPFTVKQWIFRNDNKENGKTSTLYPWNTFDALYFPRILIIRGAGRMHFFIPQI